MLEHPNRLLVHGFGSTTPRLVCEWLQINDHQPHARTDCVDDTKLPQYTVLKKFATHNDGDAPLLRVSGKRDQKLHLRATCTYPERRNLHERLGHEPGSGETADDARGGYLKNAVPRVGALCRFSGRCPFPSLCTRGSNVPRFQCPGASTRGSNVSGFQCPEGGKTRLCY